MIIISEIKQGKRRISRGGEIPLLVIIWIVLKHFRPKTPHKFILSQPAQQFAQAQHRQPVSSLRSI